MSEKANDRTTYLVDTLCRLYVESGGRWVSTMEWARACTPIANRRVEEELWELLDECSYERRPHEEVGVVEHERHGGLWRPAARTLAKWAGRRRDWASGEVGRLLKVNDELHRQVESLSTQQGVQPSQHVITALDQILGCAAAEHAESRGYRWGYFTANGWAGNVLGLHLANLRAVMEQAKGRKAAAYGRLYWGLDMASGNDRTAVVSIYGEPGSGRTSTKCSKIARDGVSDPGPLFARKPYDENVPTTHPLAYALRRLEALREFVDAHSRLPSVYNPAAMKVAGPTRVAIDNELDVVAAELRRVVARIKPATNAKVSSGVEGGGAQPPE